MKIDGKLFWIVGAMLTAIISKAKLSSWRLARSTKSEAWYFDIRGWPVLQSLRAKDGGEKLRFLSVLSTEILEDEDPTPTPEETPSTEPTAGEEASPSVEACPSDEVKPTASLMEVQLILILPAMNQKTHHLLFI